MSSQSSNSSSKDTSKKESSELRKLHFVASFEHQKLLEDVSNKAYDLGVKAGREQASPQCDDETQALILSLTDRNDELEKQTKDLKADALLELAKDVHSVNHVASARRAVSSATLAGGLKRNESGLLRASITELGELGDKCKECVEILRATMKRAGGALERERPSKRPFLG
ncbi:hypothetical protein FGADI_4574 [Fusarium gaditjirri]|uniref:Uncharacterized protein n=1 Tax=Fusarium gaditjirri TaxID=282569 RepID=A0A8H4TCE3_9HYPO|nr:hypothetical protein FGADI_4574 [Fusarium gaditjirri]